MGPCQIDATDVCIYTPQDPLEIRMRLRFLSGQYTEDSARAVDAQRERIQALRDAGVPAPALKVAETQADQAVQCAAANRQLLAELFAEASFAAQGPPHEAGAALYDSAVQVLRCLARDWSPTCAAARAQSLEPVLQRLAAYGSARLLVPGCGLGRLALEAAAKLGCRVTASDESAAMLAALAGLLCRPGRFVLFPALDASAPGLNDGDRFFEAEAEVPEELARVVDRVVLEHRDLLRGAGDSVYDAVATVFVLDAVASLPAAVEAVAQALEPGGIWVNCGPLRKHREARAFSFADVAVLAEAAGMRVLEERRFADCEYVPREVALGSREVYDVQLLVCRKEGQ